MNKTAARPAKTAVHTKNPDQQKADQRRNDLISYVLLGLILLLVAAIRSNFKDIPFERDEGIYSYIGNLILEGKTPYIDFYEQKFPGLFYFYALMVGIFGDSVGGLHTGFMLLNLLTIVALFFAAKKLFGPVSAVVTAATFAIVSMTPMLSGFTVQSEHGVVFFASLGLLAFAHYFHTQKLLTAALMGLAFSLAFMTKTNGVFFVLWGGFSILALGFHHRERRIRHMLLHAAIYSVAVFAVVGIFFLVMLAEGAFGQMMYFAYEVPRTYVSQMKLDDGLPYFRYTRDAIVENYKLFWYHGLLALPVCFLKAVPRRLRIPLLLLAFFSFLTIVPGFYFYGHYWIQILPGLALLSGVTAHGLTEFIAARVKFTGTKVRWAYVAVFILGTLAHLNSQKKYYFRPNYDLILRNVYGANPFPESQKIADYINANAKPEDDIVVFGSEPQIYIYTNKKSPSRHAYFAALVADTPFSEEWQKEFAADIEAAKPRYFIYFNHSISLLVTPKASRWIFDWSNKYLAENYGVVGVVDMANGQIMSNYVWGAEAATYAPKGQYVIYIFERKTP